MDNETYGDIYIYSSMIIIIHKQANQSLIHESTIPSVHACVVDDDDDDDDDD
jgi:hypothetical protein